MPMPRELSKLARYKIMREYIDANIDLYNKAYAEKATGKHLRHKHHAPPTAFGEFILKVRKDFEYSPRTVDIDIWNKFMLSQKDREAVGELSGINKPKPEETIVADMDKLFYASKSAEGILAKSIKLSSAEVWLHSKGFILPVTPTVTAQATEKPTENKQPIL